MVQIQAESIKTIPLGHRGENEAREVIFDLAEYISTYGPGTARLLHQRPDDPAPYVVPAVQDGDTLTWAVTDADTAAPGTGSAELQWMVNDVLAKSDIWNTKTKAALDDGATAPPTGAEGWYQQLVAYIDSLRGEGVSEEQIAAAVDAYLAENPVDVPVQSVNGKTGAVQLTAEDVGALGQDDLQAGVDAALERAKASGEFDGAPGDPGTDGITPTIGANGNWYLGDTDTGKPSRGEAGPDGADGADGAPGADGKSAYQYAVEGGFTGTESEFAAKLAVENIPVPATAEVGQTIVVKAVDDEGKPTEWETADVPSGGDGWTTIFERVYDAEENIYPVIEITDFGEDYTEFEMDCGFDFVSNTGNGISIYVNGIERYINFTSNYVGTIVVRWSVKLIFGYAFLLGQLATESGISGSLNSYLREGTIFIGTEPITKIGYKCYGAKVGAGSTVKVRARQ